jgi:hypothetical protein
MRSRTLLVVLTFVITQLLLSQVLIYIPPPSDIGDPKISSKFEDIARLSKMKPYSDFIKITNDKHEYEKSDYFLSLSVKGEIVFDKKPILSSEAFLSLEPRSLLDELLLNMVRQPIVIQQSYLLFKSFFPYSDYYILVDRKTDQILGFITDFAIDSDGQTVYAQLNKLSVSNYNNLGIAYSNSIYHEKYFSNPEIVPFPSELVSSVETQYRSDKGILKLKNNYHEKLYFYAFSKESLINPGEPISPLEEKNIQLTWRSNKIYVLISKKELVFDDFDDFIYNLKGVTKAKEGFLMSFKYPEKWTKSIETPIVELLKFDYQSRAVLLRINNYSPEFEYFLISDKNNVQKLQIANDGTFKVDYSKNLKRFSIISRRYSGQIILESEPYIVSLINIPPDLILSSYTVKNGDTISVKLFDVEGMNVVVKYFKSDDSGITYEGGILRIRNAKVGVHLLEFEITDGVNTVKKEIVLNVVNTPPSIKGVKHKYIDDRLDVEFFVDDPDPQEVQITSVLKSLDSLYNVKKTTVQSGVTFIIPPDKNLFLLKYTVSDGAESIEGTKEIEIIREMKNIKYESVEIDVKVNYENKLINVNIKIPTTEKSEGEITGKLYVSKRIEDMNTDDIWDIMNSDDARIIPVVRMTQEAQYSINLFGSGHYFICFLGKDSRGNYMASKKVGLFFNQPPTFRISSVKTSGLSTIINFEADDNDGDDLKIKMIVRKENGEIISDKTYGNVNAIYYNFGLAGEYDVTLFAIDRFGFKSNEEKIKISVPEVLPKVRSVSPRNEIIKPSTFVELRWELDENTYRIPVTYEVYFGIDSQNLKLVAQTEAKSIVLSVEPGNTYFWKVVARFSKKLSTETNIERFYIEKEIIRKMSTIRLNRIIQKLIADPLNPERTYVLLSDGSVLRITLDKQVPERLGSLYSITGDFYISEGYLLRVSKRDIRVFDIDNLNLIHSETARSEVLSVLIRGKSLVYLTSADIVFTDLVSKTSEKYDLPYRATAPSKIYFEPRSATYIVPVNNSLIFVNNGTFTKVDLQLYNQLFNILDFKEPNNKLVFDKDGNVVLFDFSSAAPTRISKIINTGISLPSFSFFVREDTLLVGNKTGNISILRISSNDIAVRYTTHLGNEVLALAPLDKERFIAVLSDAVVVYSLYDDSLYDVYVYKAQEYKLGSKIQEVLYSKNYVFIVYENSNIIDIFRIESDLK